MIKKSKIKILEIIKNIYFNYKINLNKTEKKSQNKFELNEKNS